MRSNRFVPVLLLAFAGLVFLASSALPFGTARVPQAGFFPKILVLLLMLLALSSFIEPRSFRETKLEATQISATNWFRLGVVLAALAGFALLIEPLGFLLTSFLFMVTLLRAVEAQSWPRIILTGFAAAVISYLIFARLLGVALPTGILRI
jgi:putative tricarboxylic transport membrane protein